MLGRKEVGCGRRQDHRSGGRLVLRAAHIALNRTYPLRRGASEHILRFYFFSREERRPHGRSAGQTSGWGSNALEPRRCRPEGVRLRPFGATARQTSPASGLAGSPRRSSPEGRAKSGAPKTFERHLAVARLRSTRAVVACQAEARAAGEGWRARPPSLFELRRAKDT